MYIANMWEHTGVALGVQLGDRINIGTVWYTVISIEYHDKEDGFTVIKFLTTIPKSGRKRINRLFNWEFKPLDFVKYQTERTW